MSRSLVIASLIGIVIGFLLRCLFVLLLWNWLMPLFGIIQITYLQSIGLVYLAALLIHKPDYTKVFKNAN